MATKPLPSQEVLRQLLRYEPETGKLFWKERTPEFCGSASFANQWNGRNAGAEAFTATDPQGYRHGKIANTKYQAHRVIWKWVYGVDPDIIDHRNGSQGDNRLENMRDCSNAENSRNYRKPAGGSSLYRGVTWVKRDKRWAARISAGDAGKKNLGYFADEADAARAYDSAANALHGDFAILNFPQEA